MNLTSAGSRLNQVGLFAFKQLYADLAPVDLAAAAGTWRAAFTGPAWFRAIAPRGLYLLRFGGWWGKELHADGTGMNLFERGGRRFSAFPIDISTGISILDGKPCLKVRYGRDAAFPWAYVTDEVRRLDGETLFGMTVVDPAGSRGLPLPFLLHRSSI
jgi:hypothetical protein